MKTESEKVKNPLWMKAAFVLCVLFLALGWVVNVWQFMTTSGLESLGWLLSTWFTAWMLGDAAFKCMVIVTDGDGSDL